MLAPITLEGQHVTLEPLLMEHAAGLLASANESRTTYAFTVVPADLESMERYIAVAQAEHREGVSLPFAVRDAQRNLVGSTRFMTIERWIWPDRSPRENEIDALEIGFTWYAERVQRSALNTEAKLLLAEYAFETLLVKRISWKTDSRNHRSRAAILRLGARFDGILRAHRIAADGVVRDTAFFSMLREEWPEARIQLHARLAKRQ